jgi:hypothetical protein
MKKTMFCDCGVEFEIQRRNGIVISKKCSTCINVNKKSINKKKPPTEQQLCEKLRKKCVQIAKDISKKRDDYKCQYCGIGKPQRQVHSHHIFHEGMFKSMSADPENLLTLCATHHQGGVWMKSSSGFNFHNSPRESTEWFMEKYPERYKRLKEKSLQYAKLDMQYWITKLNELKKLCQ